MLYHPKLQARKDEQKRQAMVEWNRSFSSASSLFPPVRAEMDKGSLACSHTNLMFRCCEANLTSTLTGSTFSYDKDEKLKYVVTSGHLWIVISDDCPPEDQRAISEWRNADNGQTQFKHEIEMMKSIQEIMVSEFKLAETVPHR